MSRNRNTAKSTNGPIGKPIDRVDGRLKVTGTARYAAEFPLENVAHAVLVGSTIARGRITSIDREATEKAPGVLAVITHENARDLRSVPSKPGQPPADERLPLQGADVHYSDQYVAVVVAETLEQAQHGAELLRIAYDTQPPEAKMEDASAAAKRPQGKVADKPADVTRGNMQAGLDTADVRVSEIYRTPTEHHNPMEPHATMAAWDGDKLTVYDATQYTYGVRHFLATTFGVPEENVRVICKFVGGAFGCKGNVWRHVPLAVMAARAVRRPIRLVVTRQQMFANVGHRAETEQHVTLAATRDGHLTATAHEGLSHTSTFQEYVEPFSKPTHMMYASPNLRASQRLVELNVGTPTYMRAPGEASGMYALECAMDELAYALKMDPIELRLVNYAERDPDKNLPWSTKALRECYERGAKRFGWSRRTAKPRSMRDGRMLLGMGMASAVYPVNHFPSSARVVIRKDGTAVAESSTHELGTGTYTVLTQIAAEALGLPVDRVEVNIGDTNLPKAFVSGGSSTVMSVGTSIHGAAKAAIRKIVDRASKDRGSPLFGAEPDTVVASGGRLALAGDASKGETYEAALSRAGLDEVEGTHDATWKEEEKFSSHSFGAMFAEVRVDPDFGEVRVSRYTGVFGVGRAMNIKTTRSQLIGGIVMGIGMGLMEETVYDPNFARVVNHDLAEYHVPVNADIPDIDVVVVDEFDPHASPIGAKGVGEIGIVGTAAAIANAVYHATGVRVRELPITPDKLL